MRFENQPADKDVETLFIIRENMMADFNNYTIYFNSQNHK